MKINFSKHVLGILLLACVSVFLFFAYNVFFVFPSFSNLLVENMESEAARIAAHFDSSILMTNKDLGKASITPGVRNEAGLLKKDFGLWKIRLVSPERQVVFSTEPSEIGRVMKGKLPAFDEAMAKGRVFSHFVGKGGLTHGGNVVPADLAIAYVPAMVSGRFAGACGVYYDVSPITKKARSLQLQAFAMLALLVSGLLAAVVIVSMKANKIAGAKQKAEDALQRSEYFLRTIIETEPECVKLIARDGTLLMMNPAGLAMIQASSLEEVQGTTAGQLVTPEYRGAFDDLTRRVLSGETGTLEFQMMGLKGRRLWLETNAVPFTNEKGEITGLLGITRDVTARKRWTEDLERSLREKETLLRELYHRTKNNMQVITSLISLQSASLSDSRILQMFDDTKNRIRAMALVHEKLYQSKDLSNVNMNDYIRDLANVLLEGSGGEAGNVALRLEADSVQLPIDAIMPCGLIINELVTNSLKYAFTGGRKGEIRISFRRTGPGLMELIYSDDGPGLPFAGLKDVKTLGLKLVHNLATKQLGGNIPLAPGGPAEFRITFKI